MWLDFNEGILLAQLFPQLCWKTGYFPFHSSSEIVAHYLFPSSDVGPCMELPQSKSRTVWRGRNVNVFPWGHIVSRYLYPGKFECDVILVSLLLFLFMLIPGALYREGFTVESRYFGILLPGLNGHGLKKILIIGDQNAKLDEVIKAFYVIISYSVA